MPHFCLFEMRDAEIVMNSRAVIVELQSGLKFFNSVPVFLLRQIKNPKGMVGLRARILFRRFDQVIFDATQTVLLARPRERRAIALKVRNQIQKCAFRLVVTAGR